tara:strand:- start:13959 stop:14315 length:357 start_codon:yes stop_codon:yes gene_type:complete
MMNLILVVGKDFDESPWSLDTVSEVQEWFHVDPYKGFKNLVSRFLSEAGRQVRVVHYENIFNWIDNTGSDEKFYLKVCPFFNESESEYSSREHAVSEKIQSLGSAPNKSVILRKRKDK